MRGLRIVLCLITLFDSDCARKVPFCTYSLSCFHPFEINNFILFVSEPFLAQQLSLSADLALCDIPTQILTRGEIAPDTKKYSRHRRE